MKMMSAERKRSYFGVAALLLWASSAISSTAVVVNIAVFGVWGIACLGMILAGKFVRRVEE